MPSGVSTPVPDSRQLTVIALAEAEALVPQALLAFTVILPDTAPVVVVE